MKPVRTVGQLKHHGWTLLETAMVCAIVAVLATYAAPAYLRYLARGHHVTVIGAIYRAAQFIEMHHAGRAAAVEAITLPPNLAQSPPDGRAIYHVAVIGGNGRNGGYAIAARPAADGPMAHDNCGTFVLDATGRRSNQLGPDSDYEANPPGSDTKCWGR